MFPMIPNGLRRTASAGLVGMALVAAAILTPGAGADPDQHRHYQIFVGSAFFLDRMADRTLWPYSAAHVDGFYNHPVGWRALNAEQKRQVLENVTHKTSIIEGDLSGPVSGSVAERDAIIPEMAADSMPTSAMFENEVKPNKPQDTIAANVLAADQREWSQFCESTSEKFKVPTYFMTAAFQLDGEIFGRPLTWNSPAWDYMRADILDSHCAGAGLDAPVDNYLQGPPARRQAVWDLTHWTQRQGKKFIYLSSPGDPAARNSAVFIPQLQQTVASLEDNDAEPDIYALESYIQVAPGTVPESNPDGSPANTITGGAYYMLMHRDGEPGTLHLPVAPLDPKIAASGQTDHVVVTLSNSSAWLDYAPVLRAVPTPHRGAWTVKFAAGGMDITDRVFGAGYLFYQSQRLNPHTSRQIDVTFTRKKARGPLPSLHLLLQALPHTGSTALAVLELHHG